MPRSMPSVRHAARLARSNWMAATSIARASRVRCASAHFIGREWRRIYYGNTKEDADAIDFSDKFIYEELERPKSLRSIPCIHVPDSGAIKAFRMWSDKTDKIEY